MGFIGIGEDTLGFPWKYRTISKYRFRGWGYPHRKWKLPGPVWRQFSFEGSLWLSGVRTLAWTKSCRFPSTDQSPGYSSSACQSVPYVPWWSPRTWPYGLWGSSLNFPASPKQYQSSAFSSDWWGIRSWVRLCGGESGCRRSSPCKIGLTYHRRLQGTGGGASSRSCCREGRVYKLLRSLSMGLSRLMERSVSTLF